MSPCTADSAESSSSGDSVPCVECSSPGIVTSTDSPEGRDACGDSLCSSSDCSARLGSREFVVSAVSEALQAEVAASERLASTESCSESQSRSGSTPFHGFSAPPIPLGDYIARIARHSKCSPVCFVMAYTYIRRLTEKHTRFRPCTLSVHRMVLAGVTIATKLTDDKFYSNAYHSKIGGISNSELNRLELEMLRLLDFRACVSALEAAAHLGAMPARCADAETEERSRGSKKRGCEDPRPTGYPAKLQHDLWHSEIGGTVAPQQQLMVTAGSS